MSTLSNQQDLSGIEVDGQALESHRDWSSPMGFIFERRGAGFLARFQAAYPVILAPLCASQMRITVEVSPSTPTKGPPQIISCDLHKFLVIPAKARVSVTVKSTLAEFAAFIPSGELFESCQMDHRLDSDKVRATFGEVRVVRRNNWLNEVIHRYLFERVRLNRNNTDGSRFLESEIIKEVYYQVWSPAQPAEVRVDLDEKGFQPRKTALHKAVAFVEENLLRDFSIAELAKASGASESTLLRLFHDEYACSPRRYIQDRRLVEGHRLLQLGRYSVGEVGFMLGYGSSSSFAKAFRERFGLLPSEVFERSRD
jgi:AraC-like DNA-binding protein